MLVVALMSGFNPVRLGIMLLVISRPRPMQNLFVYWIGCLIASVFLLLLPLFLLHATPLLGSFANDLATPTTGASSTARHVQIGLGVLILLSATVILVRSLTTSRRVKVPKSDDTSAIAMDSDSPPGVSRPAKGGQDEPTADGSAIRRLLRRGRNAWENGALWVSFVIGLYTGPGIDGAIYVLAIIVPSGATVAAQFGAAIMFVFMMLAIVEITLVSRLVTPTKTHALIQVLHDWTLAHGRKLLVAMLAVVGVAMLSQGLGVA
jgi:Sap, sulfolipid-1-addressing protein